MWGSYVRSATLLCIQAAEASTPAQCLGTNRGWPPPSREHGLTDRPWRARREPQRDRARGTHVCGHARAAMVPRLFLDQWPQANRTRAPRPEPQAMIPARRGSPFLQAMSSRILWERSFAHRPDCHRDRTGTDQVAMASELLDDQAGAGGQAPLACDGALRWRRSVGARNWKIARATRARGGGRRSTSGSCAGRFQDTSSIPISNRSASRSGSSSSSHTKGPFKN